MKVTSGVGLDSQCLSYLIDAMAGIEAPTDKLAQEKAALFRAYLYSEATLFVTPTVKAECRRIRNQPRRESHQSFLNVLFGEWPVSNTEAVERRVKELEKYHPKKNDCYIFAEAENVGMRTLLSYDDDFLNRLSGKSVTLQLLKPSEFWAQLAVPKGTEPKKVPHETNPLSNQAWWRW